MFNQNDSRNAIPFSKRIASSPGSPGLSARAISFSQILINLIEPTNNGAEFESYKLEWNTSYHFGENHVIQIQISSTIENDIVGSFNLVLGNETSFYYLESIPISIHATACDIHKSLISLSYIGNVVVNQLKSDEFENIWEETFTQDLGSTNDIARKTNHLITFSRKGPQYQY